MESVSRLARCLRRWRVRIRRAVRRRNSPPWPGRDSIEPQGGQAARMMADGLWVEKLTAAEAAEAMRRPAEWVAGVADGTIDPTLDELEVALNAIGLETRIGINATRPLWDMNVRHNREKLADKIARNRALDEQMHGEAHVQREPPQPGAQTRLYGAGPGRTDGGGCAALITRNCLSEIGITADQMAERAGIAPEQAVRLANGEWKPAADEFERILAAIGVPMAIRLEEYEWHDDAAQVAWEADPEGYEKQIEAIRQEIQSWKPIPETQTPPTSS